MSEVQELQCGYDGFENIIGGKYRLEPGIRGGKPVEASTYTHDVQVPVHVLDPNRPVTRGLSDFTLTDEVYGNLDVLPDVHPLIATTNPLGTPVVEDIKGLSYLSQDNPSGLSETS